MMIYLGSWLVRLYISLICLKFRRRCTKASCISVILKFPHVLSCLSGQVKKIKSPQKNIYSVHFSPIQGNTAVHKGQWEDCTFKSHLMSFCGERECSPCVRPDINIVLKFQKQSQCYGLRAITRPIILPLTIYSLCGYRGTCFCCAARSRLHKSTLLA